MSTSRIFHNTVAHFARGLDLAFASTALRPSARTRKSSRAESLGPPERLRALSMIDAFYNAPDALTVPGHFFPRPTPIAPTVSRVRGLADGGEVLDLRWPSQFEPLWSLERLRTRLATLSDEEREAFGLRADTDAAALLRELGIDQGSSLPEKYARLKANATAHARWFRHPGAPRTCAVLLHGYLGGTFPIEERVLPVRRLYEGGFDVALTVLPFHGPRRSEARGFLPPAFPSSDPRFTIEGFRQLVSDHQGLFDYLRAQGAPGIGLMGMSLGGYSASLLATLETRLRFAVLFIPLAAIEDFAFDHGRMSGSDTEQAAQRAGLRAAQRPISPMSRPALIEPGRVAVIAGEADRVTGLAQAERLAVHFGTHVSRFAGGHLLHVGRETAFAPVWSMLSRDGWLEAGGRGL
jgi:dienelactone hydrolase